MPRLRVRPSTRGFGPAASGIGAGVGEGLQAVSEGLSAIADLRTNKELLDIREQEQVDILEQKQFEKVERSDAVLQSISKQILRNQAASKILEDARKNRDFSKVQEQMDSFETDSTEKIVENKSKEFGDIFEVIDRSARVNMINKLGNAVQAGNLNIIKDNYQVTSNKITESVTALSTPAEIADQFDLHEEFGVSMGFTQDFIETSAGGERKAAMDRIIGFAGIVAGLALLSDPDVVDTFTPKEIQIRKTDLRNKKRDLAVEAEFVNEATILSTGMSVLDAFVGGIPHSEIVSMIEGKGGVTSTAKKDAKDFAESLFLAKSKEPRDISSEELAGSHAFSGESMNLVMNKFKAVTDSDDPPEIKSKKWLALHSDAMAILSEAAIKKQQGEFTDAKLQELRFQMAPLQEKLILMETERISTIDASTTERKGVTGFVKNLLFGPNHQRTPNGVMAESRREMLLGQGKFSNLTQRQRSLMTAFITDEAIKTEKAGEAMDDVDAVKIANEMEARAFIRVMAVDQGLTGQPAEDHAALITNNGEPATEAKQNINQSLLTDTIRSGFNQGMTEEAIRRQAREFPGFSDEAFNRAVITVDKAIAEAPALPKR